LLISGGIGSYFLLINNRDNKETAESSKEDAKRFAEEYTKVSEDNVFVYKTPDDIIDILKHGTGVTYLGFPECPWCGAYVKYLNEVAREVGIEKIYYTNTKSLKETDMNKYYEIVDLLEGHLEYNNEGKPWIFVPNVTFVINGEIIGNNNETAKDTHGLSDPEEYWTEEEVKSLKETLRKYMEEIKTASSTCASGCNK
ncbi:MAG: hypothetical protein K2J20_03355, partial [Bacilli bacterium]|nr:hypothetical protein [Bacilli bacterium]